MTSTAVTDTFTGGYQTALDLVLVIDDSGSMSSEQSDIAAELPNLVSGAMTAVPDLQILVTSGGLAGAGVGVPAVMTPLLPNLGGELQSRVQVGGGGPSAQPLVHAAWAAVSPPLTAAGGTNEGLLRDGAALRYIIATDGDDESLATQSWSTSDYLEALIDLKRDPGAVVVHGVSGGVSGCAGSDPAPGLVAATVATLGVDASICSGGWLAAIEGSAFAWTGPIRSFPLSSEPDVSTLEVTTNSVPIYVGWVYEAAWQAVVFDADHIPNAGDSIEVTYEPAP